MNTQYVSAQSAIDEQKKSTDGHVIGLTSKFTCPFNDCRTYAVHRWGASNSPSARDGAGLLSHRNFGSMPPVNFSLCEACGREAIYIGGQIVLPAETDAPPPAVDLPTDCIPDYEEARAVLPRSPRGSAALLRLVIQKLLPHLGATKKTIDASIGELVAAGKIKTQIQQALDTVRVVGNESVHPGEMDLRDDRETALAIFRIVNLIVETEITEPKRLEALYASLPQSKLDGIAKRDAQPEA
ncbi:DUF4145 domain-containing protein [Sphingorhabdus sp.]|jgi:hypothetical protein|uniref:DUF4145 domain-containing protein n=1 Tax=Sphingorhabdus sp. TaxID=1902408 RepID=UPI003D81372B